MPSLAGIAISGLIPDFPLTILLIACLVNAKSLYACGHGQTQRLKAIVANDATGMDGVFYRHARFLSF